MKKLNTTIAAIACAVLSLGNFTYADNLGPEDINVLALEDGDRIFNYGFKAGTLGVGVDVSTSINSWIALRFNANGFNYSGNDDSRYNSFLETDKKYELQTVGLLVDYYLWQIRLTTGVYINNNTILDSVQPTATAGVYFNGTHYTQASVTAVDQTINFNNISPYVGFGWGNNPSKEGWSVTLDVGLMYHGDPELELDITMNPNITLSEASSIRSNAEEEIKVQERDLSDFPFYPVVMIGLSYSF